MKRALHKWQAVDYDLLSYKGGDRYADYIDVSCSILDCYNTCEKQQPPLGQVTVVVD